MKHTHISTTHVGLNFYETIKNSNEISNFYNTVNNKDMIAGDLFTQNIIIKGLDMTMDTSLIDINDIHNVNNIKKIINKIYDKPLNDQNNNFGNNMHAIYFNNIITHIDKGELIDNYILNANHKKDKLKTKKDIFHLFVDILFGYVIMDCNNKYKEYGNDNDIQQKILKYYKFMDDTLNYISPNYDYNGDGDNNNNDSDNNNDNNDNNGSDSDNNNNDDGDVTNKRKFKNIPTNPNKKPKF